MSNDKIIDFTVSSIFQKRLIQAFISDERSNVDIAKDIGISKDVFIRALNTGLVPSTRSLIKIADYLEESIDYLLGLSNENAQRKTIEKLSFQERLEELRATANKRYGTIASDIGISRSQFNSWRQKNYIPCIEICYQLSLYFKVSIDYLLARE